MFIKVPGRFLLRQAKADAQYAVQLGEGQGIAKTNLAVHLAIGANIRGLADDGEGLAFEGYHAIGAFGPRLCDIGDPCIHEPHHTQVLGS